MERENTQLYKHIVKLGRIYRAYSALRTGSYERISITNQQLLFKKVQGEQTVYVALNLGDYEYDLNFGTHLTALVDVLNAKQIQVENGSAYVKMPPYSAMIIVSDDIVNNEPQTTEVVSSDEDKETEIVADPLPPLWETAEDDPCCHDLDVRCTALPALP